MAYKIKNADFFKTRLQEEITDSKVESPSLKVPEKNHIQDTIRYVKAKPFKASSAIHSLMSDTKNLLVEGGLKNIATELEKVKNSADHERFTIAVTGEFSRGKSTFINKLLEKDFLPIGDLPTTAVMTRIIHHPTDAMLIFDQKNKKKVERKLSKDSWDDLVVQNFGGNEFKGQVLIGLNSKWLKDTNIEIVDTPGAGDLNESRSKGIGDMLLGCDGAIITISAISPLSLSEKLFIEERLLARKIPFLLLIVTKLDLVDKKDRSKIIHYLKTKLNELNVDIPIYIPYEIEMDNHEFDDIMGMDKIKQKIQQWITYPQRVRILEEWLLEKTEGLLQQGIQILNEKRILLEEKDQEKRNKLIKDKKQKLSNAELVWGDYRLAMHEKCTQCYRLLLSKVDEYSDTITERLQYEVSHTNNPQKWWKEDFPYRIKIELTNLSVNVENLISKQIESDVRWYSTVIEKSFHSNVLYEKQSISDKGIFGNFEVGGKVEFDDLGKQRNIFRVGAAVLSISGFVLCSSLGFLPIIATIGIGTGTSIASEKIFHKKIEDQKDALKKEIARSVPHFIMESMKESEKRLENVYNNIILEAEKTQNKWLETQLNAINEIENTQSDEQVTNISSMLLKLQKQKDIIQSML